MTRIHNAHQLSGKLSDKILATSAKLSLKNEEIHQLSVIPGVGISTCGWSPREDRPGRYIHVPSNSVSTNVLMLS